MLLFLVTGALGQLRDAVANMGGKILTPGGAK
jgi:hypothetical protein